MSDSAFVTCIVLFLAFMLSLPYWNDRDDN